MNSGSLKAVSSSSGDSWRRSAAAACTAVTTSRSGKLDSPMSALRRIFCSWALAGGGSVLSRADLQPSCHSNKNRYCS